MSDQTYNQASRPFPFPAPHDQRIAELEAVIQAIIHASYHHKDCRHDNPRFPECTCGHEAVRQMAERTLHKEERP